MTILGIGLGIEINIKLIYDGKFIKKFSKNLNC